MIDRRNSIFMPVKEDDGRYYIALPTSAITSVVKFDQEVSIDEGAIVFRPIDYEPTNKLLEVSRQHIKIIHDTCI